MSEFIECYWRDATPADAIKEPPMVARFRDRGKVKWTEVPLRLMGLCRASCVWSDTDGYTFHYCQVYDAPDPGEGWRLIDPEKESPEEGDEFFEHGYWKTRRAKTDPFAKTFYYRRRIEQPKPQYVPFAWEDREQLRGRWIKEGDNVEIQVTAFHCNSKGVFYSEGRSAKVLVERWRFLDTGKPVGKEVVQ